MNTEKTINSKNFKLIKCPTCQKYPERARWPDPFIRFIGIRWNAGMDELEIQGYCECCHKEFRIIVYQVDISKNSVDLFNPKLSKMIGPVDEFVRR